jgi:hypothetical protein
VRSQRTLLIGGLLGLVVVAAAGIQGAAQFSGLRWNIDLQSLPTPRALPTMPASSLAPASPPAGTGVHVDIPAIVLWAVLGVAAAIAIVLIVRRILRRRRRGIGLREVGALTAPAPAPQPEPEPEPEAPALRRGIEEALRHLDDDREPADAVIRAWLGLQQTAEESGIQRRAAETPTEFTTRIMRHVTADDRAVGTLLRLYLRTRFGDHPVTAADVAGAREALEGLASTWDDGADASRSLTPAGRRPAGSSGGPGAPGGPRAPGATR